MITRTRFKIICTHRIATVSHTTYKDTWEEVEHFIRFCLRQGVEHHHLTVYEIQETEIPGEQVEEITL